MDNQKNKEEKKSFITVYQKLVDTLSRTYGLKNLPSAPTESNVTDRAAKFRADLLPYADKIKKQDPLLMLEGIDTLTELQIPAIWVGNTITPKSKEYIWQYLGKLLEDSKFIVSECTAVATLNRSNSSAGPSFPKAGFPPNLQPEVMENMFKMFPELLPQIQEMASKVKLDTTDPALIESQLPQIMTNLMSQVDMTAVGKMLETCMAQFSNNSNK